MKKCSKCLKEKGLDCFYKRKHLKNSYYGDCILCRNLNDKQKYNSEEKKLENSKYYKENKEKCNTASRNYQLKNKEILKEKAKLYVEKNREKIMIQKSSQAIERRTQKITAGAKWLDKDLLKDILYKVQEIRNLNKLGKEKYHLDHIIPLKHDLVCGLHVPWNLQILTQYENCYKSNKFDGTYENETWKTSITPKASSSYHLEEHE
jgi:hypothetical protein